MRRFVLGTIELFGRYTAVLIFALACAAGVVWLSFLDTHPKTVIALAIVVIPVFTASVALLIGLLFSGLAQAGGERLTREEAPDPGSTHPSLKERVQAHGIMELPDVGPVGPAAADVLLSPETKARLIKTFDDEWIKLVDQHVRLE